MPLLILEVCTRGIIVFPIRLNFLTLNGAATHSAAHVQGIAFLMKTNEPTQTVKASFN